MAESFGRSHLPEALSPVQADDKFAARLRGFGPIGILAILIILGGNFIIAPLSAILVLVWAKISDTPVARGWLCAAAQLGQNTCDRGRVWRHPEVYDESLGNAALWCATDQSGLSLCYRQSERYSADDFLNDYHRRFWRRNLLPGMDVRAVHQNIRTKGVGKGRNSSYHFRPVCIRSLSRSGHSRCDASVGDRVDIRLNLRHYGAYFHINDRSRGIRSNGTLDDLLRL
jgi:hypothetical protein